MPSLLAYLAVTAERPLPFAHPLPWLPPFPSRLQVYAALVGMNGGPRVTSWGKLREGGIYGRQGLSNNEAFALLELTAFVNGWLEATNGAEQDALRLAVEAEFARVKALRALEQANAAPVNPVGEGPPPLIEDEDARLPPLAQIEAELLGDNAHRIELAVPATPGVQRAPVARAYSEPCAACGARPAAICDLCCVCEEEQHKAGGKWDAASLERLKKAKAAEAPGASDAG
jgi:hypothetical protein